MMAHDLVPGIEDAWLEEKPLQGYRASARRTANVGVAICHHAKNDNLSGGEDRRPKIKSRTQAVKVLVSKLSKVSLQEPTKRFLLGSFVEGVEATHPYRKRKRRPPKTAQAATAPPRRPSEEWLVNISLTISTLALPSDVSERSLLRSKKEFVGLCDCLS